MSGLISQRRFPHGRGVALFSPRVIVSDAFGRADSALSLGSAETGGVWTPYSGTWGISGSHAYNASASGVGAYIDAATANCTPSVRVTTLAGEPGLLLRWSTGSSWWRCVLNNVGTTLLLQRWDGSTVTTVKSQAISFTVGDRIGVRMQDDTFTGLVNGNAVFTATDAFSIAATKHGIAQGAASSASRWDDFRVTVP